MKLPKLKNILNEAAPEPPQITPTTEPMIFDPEDIGLARTRMHLDRIGTLFNQMVRDEAKERRLPSNKMQADSLLVVVRELFQKMSPTQQQEFLRVIKNSRSLLQPIRF